MPIGRSSWSVGGFTWKPTAFARSEKLSVKKPKYLNVASTPRFTTRLMMRVRWRRRSSVSRWRLRPTA